MVIYRITDNLTGYEKSPRVFTGESELWINGEKAIFFVADNKVRFLSDIEDQIKDAYYKVKDIMIVALIHKCNLADMSIDYKYNVYGGKKGFEEEIKTIKEYAKTYSVDYKGLHPRETSGYIFITLALIALNSLVYWKIGNNNLNYAISKGSAWWTLITYQFCHASLYHIVGNMVSLFFLGKTYEKRVGYSILPLYILGGIGAGLTSQMYSSGCTVGASGSIFAILGANLVHTFFERGSIKGCGKHIVFMLLMGFLNPGVDGWCHLGGFVCGAIIGVIIELGLKIKVWRLREKSIWSRFYKGYFPV